jgi:serine/threonine-protein kinase
MISAAPPRERSVTVESRPTYTRRASELGVGSELGERYTLRAVIGRGGSATVFRAWDSQLAYTIAVKVFDPERSNFTSHLRRYRREVRLGRAVRHPNVCPVFDLAQWEGRWFMTMELGAGTLHHELNDELNDAPAKDTCAAARWQRRTRDARDIVAGLAAVHAAGITHGDFSPRNVLRMTDGRLALADFGMARDDEHPTLMRGGTFTYVSPEVMLGASPDCRSDVWQLGIVLHELLLGQRPRWRFDARGPVAEAALPSACPGAPAAILALAASCLTWDPAKRPASASELARRLET